MKKLIGKSVKYFDYLDTERFGTIVAIEPYPNDPEQVYVYISDTDEEFNIHSDLVNGQQINYAELRLSSEVYFDE